MITQIRITITQIVIVIKQYLNRKDTLKVQKL